MLAFTYFEFWSLNRLLMVFLACYIYSITELVGEVLLMSFISFYICLLNLYLCKTQIIQHCQPMFVLCFTLSPFSLGINFLSYFKDCYSVFVIAKVTPGESGIRLTFVKEETSQNSKQIIIWTLIVRFFKFFLLHLKWMHGIHYSMENWGNLPLKKERGGTHSWVTIKLFILNDTGNRTNWIGKWKAVSDTP